MNGKQLVKLATKNGWVLDHITGSHHIFVKNKRLISIPVHGTKELGKGITNSLLKKMELK